MVFKGFGGRLKINKYFNCFPDSRLLTNNDYIVQKWEIPRHIHTFRQPAKENQSHDTFPITNSTTNKGFSYCVMGIGTKYKLISGMSVCSNHSVGETTMFPDAYFQTLRSYPNLENVLGDGIYASRWITDIVSKMHLTPFFLPKSNVTFQSKGYSGWYDMLYSLWEDPQKWLEQYHMRSISETVNSMVKCRFGATQRKKLNPRKATETKLKNVAHDVMMSEGLVTSEFYMA